MTGTVPPTEDSKWHTKRRGTQTSHDGACTVVRLACRAVAGEILFASNPEINSQFVDFTSTAVYYTKTRNTYKQAGLMRDRPLQSNKRREVAPPPQHAGHRTMRTRTCLHVSSECIDSRSLGAILLLYCCCTTSTRGTKRHTESGICSDCRRQYILK